MKNASAVPATLDPPQDMRIVRAALYDEVVQRLRQMIFEGELAPGSRVPERVLCERFGISRTPLREALRALASEGLIELAPHRGARVSRLSPTDLDHMFEIMEALEALAGELACVRITEAGIAHVKRLHEEMVRHYRQRNRPEYFRCNQRIHESLVQAAGNPVLSRLYASLGDRMRRARYMANLSEERWRQAVEEHEAILDALIRRDAARIGPLLKAHLHHKRIALNTALQTSEQEESVQDASR
ncbi:MAG: GntR family transcriptional regulator [Pseudomonadota bacterium]